MTASNTASNTATASNTPAPMALTTTAATATLAASLYGGVVPAAATPGKRQSGGWQGAATAQERQVAKANGLAPSQVRAIVYLAAGGTHHNPRVFVRLAAKGLCTANGAITPAGRGVVAALAKLAAPAPQAAQEATPAA